MNYAIIIFVYYWIGFKVIGNPVLTSPFERFIGATIWPLLIIIEMFR